MENLNSILRTISEGLRIPVTVVLIIYLILTVFILGQFLAETVINRKRFNINLPEILDNLEKSFDNAKDIINDAVIFHNMKQPLLNILSHTEYSEYTRNALAQNAIEKNSESFNKTIKLTDFISKTAPMFGLLGTLIPLGPGIIALGQGDTFTLSSSLLTAFDTTVAGLICSAVCMLVSQVRKSKYNMYMSVYEAIVECIVLKENEKCKKGDTENNE